MNPDRKLLLFMAVFVLLIVSVAYRLFNPFVHQETDRLKYAGKKPSPRIYHGKIKTVGVVDKNSSTIERFLNKKNVSGDTHKDLFAVYRPPGKVPAKKKVVEPERKIQLSEDEKRRQAINEARQHITSYTWYGTYRGPDAEAVFLAKNKTVLVARKGDRLEGKYEIEDIQEKFLKVRALDLNETLDLEIREFKND